MNRFIILTIAVLRMATFHIQLQKPYYRAGDTVSGQVLLAVPASISGCQGISLHLSAFECLKWVSPQHIPQPSSSLLNNSPSAVFPSTNPLNQLQHAEKIEVSECASQQKSDSGLRPKYVRTAKNEFYQVKFHEQRKELASAIIRIFEGNKLIAGHYSFPFSFKTFQHWPGSFDFSCEQRKAQVRYKLTAAVDPVSPHFDFEGSRQIVIAQHGQGVKGEFTCQVTSLLCIGKGRTAYSLAWKEESYSPKSTASLVLSVDNSQCTADIKSIVLSLVHCHTLEEGKKEEQVVYSKEIEGVRNGEKKVNDRAIMENIELSKIKGLFGTTHGQLINSETHLNVTLIYDALFYSNKPVSIPLKIHSLELSDEVPLAIQKNFKPKSMPSSILNLQSAMKLLETGQKFAVRG